jgi:hypothetical protein
LSSLFPIFFAAYHVYRYKLVDVAVKDSLVYAMFAVVFIAVYTYGVRRLDQFLVDRFEITPALSRSFSFWGWWRWQVHWCEDRPNGPSAVQGRSAYIAMWCGRCLVLRASANWHRLCVIPKRQFGAARYHECSSIDGRCDCRWKP